MTTLDITNCALHIKKRFEAKGGYEVVVFHSNGNGGRAMEEMIDRFDTKFSIYPQMRLWIIFSRWGDAGPQNGVAGNKDPPLIAPGNIDHIVYSHPIKYPIGLKINIYMFTASE